MIYRRPSGSWQTDKRLSKKAESHAGAVALYTMHYNFARQHRSLANPNPWTPATLAGIAENVWTCDEIAALLD